MADPYKVKADQKTTTTSTTTSATSTTSSTSSKVLADTATSLSIGDLPADRAGPFLKLYKRIRNEFEGNRGESLSNGKLGAGFLSSEFQRDYDAKKNSTDDSSLIDSENVDWPPEDTATITAGRDYAWESKDQYYFELVSLHQETSSHREIGTGERRWLDPNEIYDEIVMSNTTITSETTDTPKTLITKRIEFLMQMLKMIALADKEGIENVTSRHTWLPGSNPKKDFLNIPMDEGSLNDHTCGFYFTSPDRNGSFDREGDVHAGKDTIVGQSPSLTVSGDLDGGSSHLDGSLDPSNKREWNPKCDDEIRHLYRLNAEPTIIQTEGTEYTFDVAGYRWESLSAEVTFEGFLYYLAQLINYLDVAFHSGAQGHRIAIENGLRSVFKGGVRTIFFPAGSRGSIDDPYLASGGYSNLFGQDIDTMLEVVNSERVFIPDWLREWWNAALTATSERSIEGIMLGSDSTGFDFSENTSDTERDDFAVDFSKNAIDLEACGEIVSISDTETCSSCIPNPSALVPNWTHPNTGPTFLNERECEYSAIVVTNLELPPNTDEELESFVEEGIELLLEAYKKQKLITVTYADGTEISANTIDILMGRESASMYLGTQAVDLPLPIFKDMHVSTVPHVPMKILVTIVAQLFDLLPVDFSDLKEEETPQVSTYVQLKSKDVKQIIRQVSASFRVYSKRYAAYIHEMNYDEQMPSETFGDFDFNKESENLEIFKEDLLTILKYHGFNYNIAELIKIGFEENDGSEGWKPYKIEYIEANEPGCAPILLDKTTWQALIKDAPWNNTRTLAFIAKLPDIWLDVTAMIFPEWNEIAAKYAYGLLNSEDLLEGIPENTLECFLNDLLSDPLNSIINDIAGDILSAPDAIAHKFNKMLCAGDEFDRIDDPLEELKGLYKRAYEASLSEAFAGDPVYELLDSYFKANSSGGDVQGLWSYVLAKYGWCGILALIDMILGCLLKGVALEDGLAIIIRAALKSLGPLEMEKIFIGLPADKQDEIAAAVAEALGTVTATPPWEKGYNPGNYSFGPEREGLLQGGVKKSKGKKLAEDLGTTPVSDMTAKQAGQYAYYVGELDPEDENYADHHVESADLQAQLSENFPEEYSGKTAEPKSYSGVGTIGAAADDVMDVIFEAYVEAIFDLVELDVLSASLQQIPGAAFIGSILETTKCAIPPLFNPPLSDFMKTLELDFCRGNYNLTLPKFNLPAINWVNILDTLMKAVMETIQNLVIKAIFMMIKFILDTLLTGICKLLGLVGAALQAALSDNFRESFRNALCGDESNPTTQITDEQIDASVAAMLATLSDCPTPSDEAATALITDLSSILLDSQLVELISGEATDEVLNMIKDVVQYRHPEWVCVFNNTSSISDLFKALGALIPPEYKMLPRQESMPILPAYCADQSAVDEFYENQCILLKQKGPLSEERCNEIIDGIQDRAKQDIQTLSDLAQNGGPLENLLPEIFADDPQCPGTWNAGIFPRNEESVVAAASTANKAIFDSFEHLSQKDMNGTKGVLNMVLAAKNGRGFRAHMFNLENFAMFTANKFPTQVAGHLKNIYQDTFAENLSFQTREDEFTRTTIWAADEEPSFAISERNFSARCYPSNTDFSSDYLEKNEVTVFGNKSISLKTPDFKMQYADYKNEQQYSFELEYSNYEISNDRSVLNDYYRVLITHKALAGGDEPDGVELLDGTYVWHEGFSGVEKGEEEVRELIDLASEDYHSIDIEEKLDLKKSPKNSIYAELIRGSWDEPVERISEIDPLFSPITMPQEIEDAQFDYWYEQYDQIFQGMITRIASVSGDSPVFKHGMSTEYRGPPEFDDDGEVIDLLGDGYEGAEPTDLSVPTKVYLSGSYRDKNNMDWDIPPEVYGGNPSWPAYYIQTPDYDGWMGIRQTITPDQIYTGCEPSAVSLANFASLSDTVDDLFNRLPDDSRLSESKHCAMEHPWNKILDRFSSAGLEGTIRATIRIYVLEALIRGMPTFVNLQGKFPENLDNSFASHIADTIDTGLREISDEKSGWFGDPLKYYLTFMEQVVQSFGKRIDLGDFEPTTTEQEAIDRLTGKSDKPNPLNQKYWEENDFITITRDGWPNMVSAGIMAGVGSALGPSGAIAGALIANAGSLAAAKKRKMAIWKKYISHPNNIRDTKILLNRYIKDEMEYICERFSAEYKPVIDSLHNLLLVDKRFIIGALNSDGPLDVADITSAGQPTMDKIHEYILSNGNEMQPTTEDWLSDPDDPEEYDPVGDLQKFWGTHATGESKHWPFVLEKYVKVTENPDIINALTSRYIDYGFTSPTDLSIFKRSSSPGVTGIMNFDTWREWVNTNEAILSGMKIEDLFTKWEVGVRICHLGNDDWGVYGDETGFYNSTNIENIENISTRTKAYRMYNSDWSKYKFLYPIASTEIEIDSTNDILATANSLSSIFEGQMECLFGDLVNHPRYKLLFEYCFSLPRIMSLFTIYSMKAFLPSIGGADADEWDTRTVGDDQNAGGGVGRTGFRRFDWNDLFEKSKKQAKRTFEEYYNATDLGHKSDKKSERRQRRLDLNINLDLNFNWLGFLMKRKRKAPFDADGRPCPLVEEEES